MPADTNRVKPPSTGTSSPKSSKPSWANVVMLNINKIAKESNLYSVFVFMFSDLRLLISDLISLFVLCHAVEGGICFVL